MSKVDSFIEDSSKLLEAYPSTTTLSVTYANSAKKKKKSDKSDDKSDDKKEDPKKATNSVTFKCYEPNSGKCIKLSTYKMKELSRLLTFVGPRGVSVSSKRRVQDDESTPDSKRQKVDVHKPGLASYMTNVKFDNVAPETTPAPTGVPELTGATQAPKEDSIEPDTKSKKKKKKKSKK